MSNLRKVEIFDGINTADVLATNGSYGVVTIQPNHISTVNGTTSLLGIDGVFTGAAEDITNYAVMFVNVHSDVASATDGLCLDSSPDGANWYQTECYTIAADTYKTFSHQCAAKYFRIRYINSGIAQTSFHIEVKLCTKNALDSSHRVGDTISDQDDARLVKSVLTAKYNGEFTPINASQSGNLQITDAESGLAIAQGDVTGTTFVHKFGDAPDFDIADGFVTVWDGANDGGADIMQYTYSTTADIDSLSSSSASDTQVIQVQGLDSSYNLVTQNVTLNGQTRVALSTNLIRVFRKINIGSVDVVGNVYSYVNTAIVGGIPTDKTKVRSIINNGNNQTLMALYTIPAGYTGYMRDWYASASSSKKTIVNRVKLFNRPFGQVFQLKHISAINVTGTSYIQHKYNEPEVLQAKTDVEMRADTDTDIGGISTGFDIVLVAN